MIFASRAGGGLASSLRAAGQSSIFLQADCCTEPHDEACGQRSTPVLCRESRNARPCCESQRPFEYPRRLPARPPRWAWTSNQAHHQARSVHRARPGPQRLQLTA
jgi:hypothetical protein